MDMITDVLNNKLRGIIFKVLNSNASYNQGKIAKAILDDIIPLVRADCQREIGEWLEEYHEEHSVNNVRYQRKDCDICISRLKSGTFKAEGRQEGE
ncbi:hypothetical protein LCGC14_1822010 [marine sediment metagenome]|uniref:Uncharacterized protein n=1 Tax=marine sediment metagenome TaxID=412755 RepID=A0A0F9IYC6_9ZZZZ